MAHKCFTASSQVQPKGFAALLLNYRWQGLPNFMRQCLSLTAGVPRYPCDNGDLHPGIRWKTVGVRTDQGIQKNIRPHGRFLEHRFSRPQLPGQWQRIRGHPLSAARLRLCPGLGTFVPRNAAAQLIPHKVLYSPESRGGISCLGQGPALLGYEAQQPSYMDNSSIQENFHEILQQDSAHAATSFPGSCQSIWGVTRPRASARNRGVPPAMNAAAMRPAHSHCPGSVQRR